MEIFSYILTVATLQTGVEVFLTIRNIAGTGQAQFGRSGNFGNAELWIVPKSKKPRKNS
jgi:prolipoprotein diacylglyceryltransferase